VANALVGAFQQVDFFFGGAFCALFIGLFVISLLIAIWVYRDAERRGMSGVLWLLVVLVAGIIGLIVYLVVRHDKPVPMAVPPYGPGWGAPPPGGAAPPTAPPSAAGATCRSCGAPLEPGMTFCTKCGARV
jgi:hypothetical protein